MVTTFLALAFSTNAAYAQVTAPQTSPSGCAITEGTAPEVRGLRLGMSIDQVLALFAGANRNKELKETIDQARKAPQGEMIYVSLDPATDSGGRAFDGVNSVAVGFHRGRVADFSIIYVGLSWRTVDEWVDKVAESLKLPNARAWTVGRSETPNKVLKCKGIEIEAAIQGGGASIRLRTDNQPAAESSTAAEARRRRDFKP